MSVYEKLMKVQSEIRAPKSNYNSFAKFNYRSLEDITEALKPVLSKHGATIILNDSVEVIGDRHYMKCTATFYDCETGESISNTSYAREAAEKRGMDEAQVSGMASSYCRKYCLNGLLLLDDVKDSDTDEAQIQADKAKRQQPRRNPETVSQPTGTITEKEVAILREMLKKAGKEEKVFYPKGLENLPASRYTEAVTTIKGWLDKAENK